MTTTITELEKLRVRASSLWANPMNDPQVEVCAEILCALLDLLVIEAKIAAEAEDDQLDGAPF